MAFVCVVSWLGAFALTGLVGLFLMGQATSSTATTLADVAATMIAVCFQLIAVFLAIVASAAAQSARAGQAGPDDIEREAMSPEPRPASFAAPVHPGVAIGPGATASKE